MGPSWIQPRPLFSRFPLPTVESHCRLFVTARGHLAAAPLWRNPSSEGLRANDCKRKNTAREAEGEEDDGDEEVASGRERERERGEEEEEEEKGGSGSEEEREREKGEKGGG